MACVECAHSSAIVWWHASDGGSGGGSGGDGNGGGGDGADDGDERVAEAAHAAALHPLLRAVSAPGGTAWGAVAPEVAGKTGTSDGNRDAWFIGFDDRRASGLWLGRPDGGSLGQIDGRDAAVVWGKVDAALPRE